MCPNVHSVSAPELRRYGSGRAQWWLSAACVMLGLMGAEPVFATYHFMQIELVVAGVHGDPEAQAVQLRMRENGQNEVQNGKLFASDAAGENRVLLIDFDAPVGSGLAGDRVLAVTQPLLDCTSGAIQPDVVLTNAIPVSYLAAGSLTFESDNENLVVWRLSWGGPAYTGATTGSLVNDREGEFGPPVDGGLLIDGLQGWRFMGEFADLSSTNLDDYAQTGEPATLINNRGQSWTLEAGECPALPDGADDMDTPGNGDGAGVGDEGEADGTGSDGDHPGDDEAGVSNGTGNGGDGENPGAGGESPESPSLAGGACGAGAPAAMLAVLCLTQIRARRPGT